MFRRDDQLYSGTTKTIPVGEAVASGLVKNETLAYFMDCTQLLMEKIGMDKHRLRFRQHLATEMAHHAQDYWDLEIKCSYGWIECVGHADRACYDLNVHAKSTKTSMFATLKFDKAREFNFTELKFDHKNLGFAFRLEQQNVSAALEALSRGIPSNPSPTRSNRSRCPLPCLMRISPSRPICSPIPNQERWHNRLNSPRMSLNHPSDLVASYTPSSNIPSTTVPEIPKRPLCDSRPCRTQQGRRTSHVTVPRGLRHYRRRCRWFSVKK